MANLSDLASATEADPPSWIGTLGASRGFVPGLGSPAPAPPPERSGQEPDPEEVIRTQAFEEGFAAGEQAAIERLAHEAKIADGLGAALARLDDAAERALRKRLAETVAALCEELVEPPLIHADALEKRCTAALQWCDWDADRLTLRLHPDDVAMLPAETRSNWKISPDPALPRGTLEIEAADGVVRDGPDEWRRAIAEALAL